ncbi:heavy metal-responsive transcriptional regulator [Colwellia sp. MT41]|uniref:Heavy metal-responsive transcriptional regulator n=1 Tax=Colwellia marinimaniae TaxID=1513592 RepID=A0ABQ0MVX3_9GAMM|nr:MULTISPECIES: Zn(2+)-responsive transcriptional regulator [Colwellia]ALO35595.1 heavy metal-responsive transcriptional regulator [Colwellia sp. MT41]GAW96514.1 heavy metal-responsive transcriptional regulator [Colwellia marinimaniae]
MYRIGELAQKLSVSTDTLRYYEKHKLLAATSRADNGYRLYNEGALRIMQFIIRAKAVGFSLKEISGLLSIKIDKASHSCAEVKSFTEQKLSQVNNKIAELACFKGSLELLVAACCGGEEEATHCSILSALENVDAIISK